jgi:THO complex subunit 2
MGPKRKRNERGSVDSGESRPSPHRPGNAALGGNQDRDGDVRNGGDGRRRSSQRNTRNPRPQRNDRRDSSDNFANSPTTGRPSTGTMSPPRRPSFSNQSQPATPAPTTPVLAPAKASTPEPARIIAPYDYSFVTDERKAAWTTSGRQEVIAAGIQAMDDVDILDLSSIFQELIHSALDSRIDATDAGECIKSILRPDTTSEEESVDKLDGPSLFLDSVSILADNEPASPALLYLMVASGVSPMLMRQMLDTPLLQSLGLTRNTFLKAGIRQVTNLLYRQANHNLLREETEGYSKLMTELYTAAGSAPPTSDAVEETFERVKGLIGTFDLDVGRVLDVTLDVFASVLIKQFRFFIKLLRVSSWWPRDTVLAGSAKLTHENGGLPKWALPGADNWTTSEEDANIAFPQRLERDQRFWDRAREKGLDAFFELGGRQAIDSNTKDLLLASPTSADLDADADREWIETTGTLPPSSNRTAAQLLGFKLRFYTSDARDKEDSFPPNLLYLAALLIKIGFISLRDLYPHLYPLDKDMESLRESKMAEIAEKEKANRPGGGENALMRAGALADDTLPAANRSRDAATTKAEATAAPAEVEEKEKLPEPEDQKVLLLINLLTIGAIPESLFILGRFPWLPEAYPEIYPLLHRILHESIDKIYKETLPVQPADIATTGKTWPDPDQNGAPKGSVKLLDAHVRRPLRWPFPEKRDVNDGIIYKFYWDEWTDSIPVCQTVDDIFTLCDTFLNLSGVNIGRDATLLSKLAAIGNKSLADDTSESNLARWQDLLKRLLVPALSLTKANTSMVNDIYEMLRYYPTPVRYTIYAEWFEGQISRLPAMTTSFKRTRLETLSTMKRISKENITTMARALAKSAYASPGIVFKVALDQIEAYSNLTEVVVECAKYFTDLGYDVLIWSLMSSLGGKSRSRTRDDSALLTSRWLIALSKFSGKIFKRYSNMSPAPILQYVNDQLYRGNSTDLIILEELVAQMSGVVSDIDFTDSQLSAMTGGEILRRQTLISLQDKRFESIKTAKRVMKALTETKLAGTILISIAQHRQSAIYSVPEQDAHIKYLSTLVDDAQRILGQYLDLLRSNLSVEEFDELVPNTCNLMADFGLEPALAFAIGRTSYAKRMAAAPSTPPLTDVSSENTQVDSDGNVGMDAASTNATTKSDEAFKPNGSTPTNGDVQMAEILEVDSAAIALSPSSTSTDVWHDVLTPLVAAVQKALPEKTWDILSPEFYVIFWQLALSDIQLPMESYTTENARLTREISDIMKDRSDMSRPGMNRKEEARKSLEATRDELLKESKQNMLKYERTRARLNKEKSKWFSGTKKRYDAVNDALLEDCFLPRLLLSPSDSDYCFKMIKFLHSSGAPYFRTLGLYGRLFRGNRLRSMIFTCTIREAECLGRFLRSVLGDLSRWHSSKTIYEKEAYGPSGDLPGFAKRLTPDGKPLDLLDYEEFRRIVFTWHRNLNTALRVALSGTEWMHIRNAITVLKTVVQHFPAVDFMGKSFQTQLTTIADREKNVREDLCLLANASMPELRKRERKWVMLQSFASNLV